MSSFPSILEKYLKPTTNSFFRFLLVGIVNTFVGLFIMFFLLNVLNLTYWTSTFLGNAVGACISFLLNRTFTFGSNVSYHKGVPRFFVIILICYFSAYYSSEKLTELTNHFQLFSTMNDENVSVLLGSALYTISNYLGQKHFVFKKIKIA